MAEGTKSPRVEPVALPLPHRCRGRARSRPHARQLRRNRLVNLQVTTPIEFLNPSGFRDGEASKTHVSVGPGKMPHDHPTAVEAAQLHCSGNRSCGRTVSATLPAPHDVEELAKAGEVAQTAA